MYIYICIFVYIYIYIYIHVNDLIRAIIRLLSRPCGGAGDQRGVGGMCGAATPSTT